MGKTSSAVKNRYNDKAYDKINLVVPKGQKDIIKAYAESKGESLNGFINRAINEAMKKE
jgi:predicted HicB family RNase H-like nuclease